MIGAKRHRLMVQQNRPTRGPDGGPVDNWVTLATVWAEGGPIKGDEVWKAKQAASDITHVFKIRWSTALVDLTGSVRIVLDGRKVIHVKAARNTDERRIEWVLECSEAGDAAILLQDEAGCPLLDETGDLILEP